MIIDLILDRKDGDTYNADSFYRDVMEYESIFDMEHDITHAMDYGDNKEVQEALCRYIDNGDYNPSIKDYINSQDWLGGQ